MTSSVSTTAATSARGVRRAGISLVPFAAMVVAIVAVLLCGLTLPSSSPPSQDTVIRAVGLLWVVSVVFLVVSAVWASTLRAPTRRAVAVTAALALGVLGWWVSRLLDTAWVDACEFGTGSGDRCIGGDGSPSSWVPVAWTGFGLIVGWLCAVVAVMAQHSDSA